MINKTTITLLTLLFVSVSCYGSQIGNRMGLYAGLQRGNTSNPKYVEINGVEFGTLHSNIKQWEGFMVKGYFMMKPWTGMAVSFNNHNSHAPTSVFLQSFRLSNINQTNLSIRFRLETHQKDMGISNRLNLYLEAGPAAGISTLRFAHPNPSRTPLGVPIKRHAPKTDFVYGYSVAGGINIKLTHWMGATLGYTSDYQLVTSVYYPDRSYSRHFFDAGFYIPCYTTKDISTEDLNHEPILRNHSDHPVTCHTSSGS